MYVVCERHFFLVGRAGGECHPVVLQDARFTVFNKSICLLVLFGQLAKQWTEKEKNHPYAVQSLGEYPTHSKLAYLIQNKNNNNERGENSVVL